MLRGIAFQVGSWALATKCWDSHLRHLVSKFDNAPSEIWDGGGLGEGILCDSPQVVKLPPHRGAPSHFSLQQMLKTHLFTLAFAT